jgi:UDP-3-O-[3-hydroxymyristoyl] glucosamine N-acyltransferase
VREAVEIGNDVTLQPGVVLGGDGFGFIPQARGDAVVIPQIGTVHIGDHVDVGANSTVDRATVGTTRLADGVKLDNLVMIAHGCEVGEGSMLAAQFGMAGSSRVGKGVMAGGQVGVSGHLRIGDRVRLAAQTGVASDVADGQVVAGSPAVAVGVWRRYSVLLQRLPEFVKRLRTIESEVARLGGGRRKSGRGS